MLKVNNNTSNWSIWSSVSQESFEKNIDALSRTNCVLEPVTVSAAQIPAGSSPNRIPVELEAQLVDDFAFLAAYDYGVKCVTAACLEESSPSGFTLRLAANEGIHELVQSTFSDILSFLSLCATKCMTRQNCTEKIFDVIIRLNCNRILGRFSSKHFSPPAYIRSAPKDPPSQQLIRIAQRLTAPKQEPRLVEDLHTFRAEVRMLHGSFQELERSTEEEQRLHSIGKAVKAAFRVTGDGVSLQNRLRRLSCNTSTLDSRVIHEINKVSNYWRISCTLARLSRSREYGNLFVEPKLATVQHYEPDVQGSSSRYVHAEIQLIVHYEFRRMECMPRVIGASKRACYLCYAFVKAHKQFYLLRSHGQVYRQWTVPDCREYTSETLERFQRALRAVNQEVLYEIRRLRTGPKDYRAFPLQSLINLRIHDFRDGSDTTTKSVRSSQASLTSGQLKRADVTWKGSIIPSPASVLALRNEEGHVDVGILHRDTETGLAKCEDGELTGSQIERAPQDTYTDVTMSTTRETSITTDPSSWPKGFIFGWLDLHFCPSQAAAYSSMDVELASFESNNITRYKGENTIDIDHWQQGQKITIPTNKENPELDIMFVRGLDRIKIHIALQVDC